MKDVLLISESILLTQQLPMDLLDPELFDLRTVQFPHELLPLSKVLHPKVLILDLTQSGIDSQNLEQFVRELQTLCRDEDNFIAVLGVIHAEQRSQAQEYFKSGINALLSFPLETDTLRLELQNLLGYPFRRLERKQINFDFHLSHGGQSWTVTGQTINAECVVVHGDTLPSLGLNMLLKCPEELQGSSLWVHCWRKTPEGLVLRFLNPQMAFLEAVQNLSQFPAEPEEMELVRVLGSKPGEAEEDSSAPLQEQAVQEEKAQVVPSSARPSFSFNAPVFLSTLVSCLKKEKEPPKFLASILGKLTEFERALLLNEALPEKKVREAMALKVFLSAEHHLLLTMGTASPLRAIEASNMIKAHEEVVRETSQQLQEQVKEAILKGQNEFAQNLNKLKSELQKTTVAMRRSWEVTEKAAQLKSSSASSRGLAREIPAARPVSTPVIEDDYAPAKYKERPPPEPAKPLIKAGAIRNLLEPLIQTLIVSCLIALFSFIGYLSSTAPRRKLREIAREDLVTISNHIDSAILANEKGHTSMKVAMKKEWHQLDREAQHNQINGLAANLKKLKVEYAEIQDPNGRTLAHFVDGQLKIIEGPDRP